MKEGDRVFIGPLSVMGTVVRVPREDAVSVLADCATQPVLWHPRELEVRP